MGCSPTLTIKHLCTLEYHPPKYAIFPLSHYAEAPRHSPVSPVVLLILFQADQLIGTCHVTQQAEVLQSWCHFCQVIKQIVQVSDVIKVKDLGPGSQEAYQAAKAITDRYSQTADESSLLL